MSIALYVIASLSIGLLLLAGVRMALCAVSVSTNPETPEINPSRYRPMERLLRDEDIRYLTAQGLDSHSIRRLRAERRAIFRKYLRSLRMDFGRVVGMIRLAMVQSREARPDLATALVRARVFFAYTVVAMEMRLVLHTFGMSGITIDVRPAIAALANVREQWQTMNAMAPIPAF